MTQFNLLAQFVCAVVMYSFICAVFVSRRSLKYYALRALVNARAYANTEKGECEIVSTLTALSVVCVVAFGLLIAGSIMSIM